MDDAWTRQLVEFAPDALIVVDESGRMVLANVQAERLFGYDRSELLGQPIELLIPRAARNRHVALRESYQSAPRTREMGMGRELRGRSKDGSELDVEISLGPLVGTSAPLVACAIRDVGPRRRADAAAKRTSAYLESAIQSIAGAFLLLDETGRIVATNEAARRGFGAAATVGGDFDDVTRSEGTEFALDAGAQEAWRRYRYDPSGVLDLATLSGRTVRVAHRRTVEGGQVVLVQDISADVAREAALRDASIRAQAASAAKSEFLASMSHELRTPLNAILGFAELLERDKKAPLNERQRDRLGHVLRAGEHLLRLVDDVLDLSGIEAGRLAVTLRATPLAPILDEVVTTLRPMADNSDVQLEVALVGLPAVVADPGRLAQILMNLGSNAIKYGRDGGRVAFHAVDGDVVRVSVEDHGPGIPEGAAGRLFEPFYRAGQEAGPVRGTGIGLALSKRLAERMGARIGFHSEPGRGATFWVDLPKANRLSSDLARTPRAAASRTMVVMGNDPDTLAFLRALVDDVDVDVIGAPSGDIGLAWCQARPEAFVVVDLDDAAMSQVVERLNELAPNPSRVVVGIHCGDGSMPRGVSQWLRRPLRPVDWSSALREWLGKGGAG